MMECMKTRFYLSFQFPLFYTGLVLDRLLSITYKTYESKPKPQSHIFFQTISPSKGWPGKTVGFLNQVASSTTTRPPSTPRPRRRAQSRSRRLMPESTEKSNHVFTTPRHSMYAIYAYLKVHRG